ncbi:MAG: TatD family hydrolase [Prolixibacteraceae bacterium]|nr:TatD family hydrolase [Prolixibacteraceae bacterium]
MSFTDTHSHLYLPQFDNDRNECIARAIKAGVNKMVLPNIDSASIGPMMQMAISFPANCFPLAGLHPTHVKNNFEDELQQIFSTFSQNTYYGIGETGIDLYWDKTYFEQQKEAFKQQVQFALKKNLPIVVHARESFGEILECLKDINAPFYNGIFHAFSGTAKQAMQVVEMGFKAGIGGVVTFKNSPLAVTVKEIDLNHIVLETDSPYLAPMPYRGKRNESAYIELIAEKIAGIKGVKVEEVADITTNNASHIFKI